MTIVLQPTLDERAVIALHRLFAGQHPITEPGQRFARDSWIVRERPSDFVSVTRGVDPKRAMVCIIPVDVQKPGGAPWELERKFWVTQWADPDHDAAILAQFGERFRPLGQRVS